MNVWQCFAAFWISLDFFSLQEEYVSNYDGTYYRMRFPRCADGCSLSGRCWKRQYLRGTWRTILTQRYSPVYTDNGCCPGYCGRNCNIENFGRLSYYVKKNEFKIGRLERSIQWNVRFLPILNGNDRYTVCPTGPKGDRGIMGLKGEKGDPGLPVLPAERRAVEMTTGASAKNEYDRKLQVIDSALEQVQQQTTTLNSNLSEIIQNVSNIELQVLGDRERNLRKEKELSEKQERRMKLLMAMNNTIQSLIGAQNDIMGQLDNQENVMKDRMLADKNDDLLKEMKQNISTIFDQLSGDNETLENVILQMKNLSRVNINDAQSSFNESIARLHEMILVGFNTTQSLSLDNERMSRVVDTLNEKNEALNQTVSNQKQVGMANGDNIALLQTANMALLDEINMLKNRNNELNNTIRGLIDMFSKNTEEMTSSISECQKNVTYLMSVNEQCVGNLKNDVKTKDKEMEELMEKYNKLSMEYQQLNLLIQMYNESKMSSGYGNFDDTEDSMGDMSILPGLQNTSVKESECYCVCCADGQQFTKPFPKPPPLPHGYKLIPEKAGDLDGLCSAIMKRSTDKPSTVGKDDKERQLNDYFYLYPDYVADNAQAEALKVSENTKSSSKSCKVSENGISLHMLLGFATIICINIASIKIF